ncbi:IS200/IS605 family transposase [Blastopirellula marina]|uniref:Transposase n=1 Tax=Blastopirellula marina TaxID=124 RepID=A0A2S8F7V7_9BACT|nr:IS200/IS605 family transposase [Blastopirellula marina]PQO28236.1 transposase [Blastopirellula marina]PTL41776.1 IS200/IS605 family transposase [Blastopirellula marina]
MPQSFASLYVHLIFSTKNRESWIEDEWSPRLYEYVAGTLRKQNDQLLIGGGMADHIHLLISMSRESSIVDIVRNVKSNSSRWIHENFPGSTGFAWQAGYAAFSVSRSALPEVRQYIENQKQHHTTRTFEEEFLAFLERHELEYDPRYVFD